MFLKHCCNGPKIKAFKGISWVIFFYGNTIREGAGFFAVTEDERRSHVFCDTNEIILVKEIHSSNLSTSAETYNFRV